MAETHDTQLIGQIYDAAFDPGLWVPVMEQLAHRLSGQAACMTSLDVFTGEGLGYAALVPEGTMQTYLTDWTQNNPLHEVGDTLEYINRWQPATIRYEEWVDRGTLHRSDFFNEFLRPIGSENGIMMGLALTGTRTVTMNIARPLGRDMFDEGEIALARHWQRHLSRAVRLEQSMQVGQAALDAVDRLVTTTAHCLFFLDGRGRVHRMSHAAEAMLKAGSALHLANGVLSAKRTDEETRLRQLIALAGTSAGGSMTLRDTGGQAYDVQVAPLGPRSSAHWSAEPIVLVTVKPSAAPALPLEFRLRNHFGLTPAEARLALALMQGGTLRETAERIAVSINTVRAQLGAIFAKTGCRRQADLVRTLLTFASGA